LGETVKGLQQMIDRGDPVLAIASGGPRGDGIELVDKEDARSLGPCLGKSFSDRAQERAQVTLATALPFAERGRDEGNLAGRGQRLAERGLACAGWAVQDASGIDLAPVETPSHVVTHVLNKRLPPFAGLVHACEIA
jgi:hypothetical protein